MLPSVTTIIAIVIITTIINLFNVDNQNMQIKCIVINSYFQGACSLISTKLINYVNKNYNQEICYNRTRNRKNLSAWGSVRQGPVLSGKCPSGKCPSGKCPSGKCPSGKGLVGKMSVGDLSFGEVSFGDVSLGEMSVGELSGHRIQDLAKYLRWRFFRKLLLGSKPRFPRTSKTRLNTSLSISLLRSILHDINIMRQLLQRQLFYAKKIVTRKGAGDHEILIYLYLNKLPYLQLITVFFYGNSFPKSHEQGYLNFQQKP